MKNAVILALLAIVATSVQAQTYTVISRSNDTILLHPNKLGDALKSALPGGGAVENYRLIEKVDGDKKSLLFVDFMQVLDKVFVTYETDLVHAGEWQVETYSFDNIYYAVKRENAILLTGQLLGMDIEIYQRPEPYKDVINIDGIEFDSPIKLQLYESKLALDIQKKSGELSRLGLTDEDVAQMEAKANECYIALLIKNGNFNISVDRTVLHELVDKDTEEKIQTKYNRDQLLFLSRGHDTRLNKYAK